MNCTLQPLRRSTGRTRSTGLAPIVVAAIAVALLGGFAAAPAALAQTAATPAEALDRLFTAESYDEGWFSPLFLSQLPAAQVELIVVQLRTGLGEYEGIEARGGIRYDVVFSQGVIPAQIVLDEAGRITGLFFEPPRPKVSGLADAIAPFAELPGQASVLVLGGMSELGALNADTPLAVGSTFKLAVLAALRQQIAAGERSWDDVVYLDEAWRSLPSGILQDWPAGSPVTLHTLAALMISVSDNTATDALIHIVGRENVEAFALRNRPFLMTRELFVLKNPVNEDALNRWRAADEAGRRSVLAETATLPLPSPDIFTAPRALDAEWYYSNRELCGLMGMVYDLPLMSINPGVADPDDWSYVAYKGGSEPGVISMTTLVIDHSGGAYCVSATWNDPNSNVDELRFFGLYSGLLEAVKGLAGAQ